jgi:hypothetical protein
MVATIATFASKEAMAIRKTIGIRPIVRMAAGSIDKTVGIQPTLSMVGIEPTTFPLQNPWDSKSEILKSN